ncbi:hypothetical protein [Gemella morbillorum]
MIVSNQASEKRCIEFINKFKELIDFMDTMTTADAKAIQIAVEQDEITNKMEKMSEKMKEIEFIK